MFLLNKVCVRCLKERPITDFYTRRTRSGVRKYGAKCRLCISYRMHDYYERNKEVIKTKSRNYYYSKKQAAAWVQSN